jgi:hypothetical protein
VSLAAGQGIQHLKFTYEEDFFNPCLGEDVVYIYDVSARFREAETPSGITHLVDNWSIEGTAVGQSSGRIWDAFGQSPFVQTLTEEGEVLNVGFKTKFEPIGEGPRWRINNNIKVTVNANGDLVVSRITYFDNPDKWCKILGPKK